MNDKDFNQRAEELRLSILNAGEKAVQELVKVAKEQVITGDGEVDLQADRLKNAAAAKKIAIFDSLEILERIESERRAIDESGNTDGISGSFTKRRARSS